MTTLAVTLTPVSRRNTTPLIVSPINATAPCVTAGTSGGSPISAFSACSIAFEDRRYQFPFDGNLGFVVCVFNDLGLPLLPLLLKGVLGGGAKTGGSSAVMAGCSIAAMANSVLTAVSIMNGLFIARRLGVSKTQVLYTKSRDARTRDSDAMVVGVTVGWWRQIFVTVSRDVLLLVRSTVIGKVPKVGCSRL